MHAIYLVTDETLVDIAGTQAKRIAEQWNCDVHVFVERRDPKKPVSKFNYDGRVFYHYETLGQFLPDGLPEDQKWPRIVYLRVFVPRLLMQYDRLLYIDVDILSMRAEPSIWTIDLPAGLAAVSDLATLDKAPNDVKGISRTAWLETVGVSSGRYLNSGVLLIETAKWLKIDFAHALTAYFRDFPQAARYDQDFLSHLFDGIWSELSPRMNYQAYVLELGLTKAIDPVLIHFCRRQKPWHGPPRGWSAPTDPTYTAIYRELLQSDGLNPADYERPHTLSIIRRLRYGLRAWLGRRFGIVTARERRELSDWQASSDAFLRFVEDGLRHGSFVDEERTALTASRSAPIFDGRFAVAEESRLR